MAKIIKEHISTKNLVETIVIPEHPERKETTEFSKSKKRLREDGHYKCWICGCEENLQVHHFFVPHSLQNTCNFTELNKICCEWDIYGYGRVMSNTPIKSVDDIRNMMVLCREHHTGGKSDGVANGIHNITFPTWIAQKLCSINGKDPVPDNKHELEQVVRKLTETDETKN